MNGSIYSCSMFLFRESIILSLWNQLLLVLVEYYFKISLQVFILSIWFIIVHIDAMCLYLSINCLYIITASTLWVHCITTILSIAYELMTASQLSYQLHILLHQHLIKCIQINYCTTIFLSSAYRLITISRISCQMYAYLLLNQHFKLTKS